MKRETKHYQFKLMTVAPVHIGSGDKYSQKEYIYENGHYYFPDMSQVYFHIEKHGQRVKDAFESFLMRSGNQNNYKKPRLINFLKEHNIKERQFKGYKVKETGFETESKKPTDRGNINEIDAFIKDPYHMPYIPGSSLKGAIRTILVNQEFKTDRINWGAKKGQPLDDVFHDIRVSDSDPIEPSQLILAQKWDFSIKNKEAKPLPLYRESLKPYTRVSFTITAIGEAAIALIDNLPRLAQAHHKVYRETFLSLFPDHFVQKNVQYPIYLGAGSGFWTKTIIEQAKPPVSRNPKMKMVGKGTFKLTKANDVTLKVKDGTRQLIENDESLFEMGKCNFLLHEI